MRVLVTGGRDYADYEFVRNTLDQIMHDRGCCGECGVIDSPDPVIVIHGGAKGADSLADQWAVVNWLQIKEFKADWNRYGRVAGPIRNQQMIDEGKPDLVVAFPGGEGTANMVKLAKKHGIEVIEVTDD